MNENTLAYKKLINIKRIKVNFMKLMQRGVAVNVFGILISRCIIFGGLTPLGVAFYATLYESKINMIMLFISINLGILSTGIEIIKLKYIISITMLSIVNLINYPKRSLDISIRAFIIFFAIGSTIVFYQGFLLYDFILVIFESSLILIFSLLFRNGTKYLSDVKEIDSISSEKLISISIIGIFAISGLSNLSIMGISIRNVLIIFIIMLFAKNGGVSIGAVIGLISGLIISISSGENPAIIGVYGFCGLICGALKEIGKVGVIVGFLLANSIITIYINGSTEVLININEIIISAIFITIIPTKLLKKMINRFIFPSVISFGIKHNNEKFKRMTVDKLRDFSETFYELASTFNEISGSNKNINREDISTLFEEVAERVCKSCKYNTECWIKNFYSTYQVMMNVKERIQKYGKIEKDDIPNYFASQCSKINEFINTTNYLFNLYSANLKWENQVLESKSIVSHQIKAISSIINDFAKEINSDIVFETELERKIKTELIKNDLIASEVMVIQNKNKKYEVEILLENTEIPMNIVEVVSDVIGRRMEKKVVPYSNIIKLFEFKKYRVYAEVVCISKDNKELSGDSYKIIELDEGKFILALSDGMGSGKSASLESSSVLKLLEKFLKNGINRNISIQLINSMLSLKSVNDTFATVDLAIIDLFTAKVEFLKNGAAATFIKDDNGVEVVNSTSLPVGILKNIEMETSKLNLKDEDIIVMVSDGVVDSKQDIIEKEKWIADELLKIEHTNPKLIANYLISKAKDNYNEKELDDMTVLVAKVSEKIF